MIRRTSRLSLRMPEEGDIGFLTALFLRPELVAHRPDPRPDSPEESARRLARDRTHWRLHGFGRWAIEAEGQLIGFGGVTVSTEFEGLNLSYHLHPDNWGKGYATELVTEALAFARGDLRAKRVIGLVRPVNIASRHVLEKCGFGFEREVMLHGAPTHLLSYRMAAADIDRPA
ncbi:MULTISPECIES: GNAT family N-acetyltransferase [unclassified Rhizobium]|uniref:GNAT family N-acetyltransferase n=1 Tax=unclassified Rhizobium TaxID=2613769 RepID=UPI00160D7E1D|nr:MULTISPECIES: GNAT family N-acetyltransferase [unclassified Rhizobium]MBB3381546.1 RimJ/RimL family protein N-acetyltransferase [Rhizobium sp. BK098]MBB3613248.1 RimJ/RimL family protein N-acetyltransferase [Rhizobium sp. BK609]MBB3678906.1 RimJ/RimL family protein N-acetyltransferase [Rhizobium sp. BK612]